jgi:acyl carrier protein
LNNTGGKPVELTDESLLEKIQEMLLENFEIEKDRVTPSSRLYEDLELDSIDAVDMAIRLQQMTGKRIKPEDFKAVRTVEDVVMVVRELLTEK